MEDNQLLLEERMKQYEYEKKQITKQIERIEKSKSWKYSKPLRLIRRLKNKIVPRNFQFQNMNDLQNENTILKQHILKQEEMIESLLTHVTKFNEVTRENELRQLKNEGKLIPFLENYCRQGKEVKGKISETLIYIARLYMNEPAEKRNYVYQLVKQVLNIDELPEFILRPELENNQAMIDVASYRASMAMRLRQYQFNSDLPEWQLDNKQKAYQFVQALNIKTPIVDEKIYTLDQLEKRDGIVIKPEDGAGARGVYIVHDETHIIDVKKHISLSSWDEMVHHMQKDLDQGAVEKDEWMIEEVIYEDRERLQTGRDFKFYTFYGKVGLILEIVRYPELRQCWWTADLERVSVGKYDETLFKGKGVTREEIKKVESLSRKVKAPFVRIDFLQGENGLVFGEFTPKPGNYDEFNKEYDQKLGQLFIQAQSEIEKELLR